MYLVFIQIMIEIVGPTFQTPNSDGNPSSPPKKEIIQKSFQHQRNTLASSATTALMNAPHMIFHVIHAAEDPPTPVPLTDNARVMLRLVASTVLLAGEPALLGLRASLVPAEEVLAVA